MVCSRMPNRTSRPARPYNGLVHRRFLLFLASTAIFGGTGKPQEVKRIFLASATPLGRERYFEGHGLVDLMRAIQSV